MSIILFSKKFSEKAEEIKLAAINALKEVEINTSFSDEQKERIVNNILDESIRFPQIQFIKENIKPRLEQLSLSKHEASKVLHTYTFSLSDPGINVSKVSYFIPFSGNIGNLEIGTKFPKREFHGEIRQDTMSLEFYFQGDADTNAPRIKQEKDNFIKLIMDNQAEIVDRSISLRNELSALIYAELNNAIASKKKNIEDARKFL